MGCSPNSFRVFNPMPSAWAAYDTNGAVGSGFPLPQELRLYNWPPTQCQESNQLDTSYRGTQGTSSQSRCFEQGTSGRTEKTDSKVRNIMKNPYANTHTRISQPTTAGTGTRRALLAMLMGIGVAAWASFGTQAQATSMSWDLIHLIGNVVSAGGSDSAKAADGSQITLTGSGTWTSGGDEQGQAVT